MALKTLHRASPQTSVEYFSLSVRERQMLDIVYQLG
jgi:hypothetical protein